MTLKKTSKQMLAEANAQVETIPFERAKELAADPTVAFVDIRETVELQKTGTIPGATHSPRGHLEFRADPESPMHQPVFSSGRKIVLFCASGGRSALAAKTLKDMGLENVAHLGGGFNGWAQAGGPVQS